MFTKKNAGHPLLFMSLGAFATLGMVGTVVFMRKKGFAWVRQMEETMDNAMDNFGLCKNKNEDDDEDTRKPRRTSGRMMKDED